MAEAVQSVLEEQRRFFATGATKELSFRVRQLQLLKQVIEAKQPAILNALKSDLGKPAFEAHTSEVLLLLGEINYALKHVRSWVKPHKVATPLSLFPASSYIYPEPLGVVLIIGAWNYPMLLILNPLVGAIAAGNCTILKPSEIAPHTSKAIAEIIAENFDPGFISVVEGGIETNQVLLTEKFDRIFFTGSPAVGKIVMEAAAKHLTPVTLELGGKSPCIVDAEVDVQLAARRIAWGKFYNAGQTCVAPDFVLVNRAIASELLEGIQKCTHEFYGDDPQKSPDYARIVNDKQFSRLTGLLGEGKVVFGGVSNREERYIAPTVLCEIAPNAKVMEEEIFGPILPVLVYDDLSEAIALVNAKPKPLALYFFSTNKKNQARIMQEISFGGGCINDTNMHSCSPELPFGGIGNSGIGSYHGKAGFDTFSHKKSVLHQPSFIDLKWRYPPYKINPDFLKWLV